MKPIRQKSERGNALLEFALGFSLLWMLFSGVYQIGYAYYIYDGLIQQFITERARATVRNAVVNNWTTSSSAVQNYLVYNSTTAPTGGGAGFLGLQTSNVTSQILGAPGTPDYMLQVKVSGVPAVTWIPFISGRYTLAPITAAMPMQSLGATN